MTGSYSLSFSESIVNPPALSASYLPRILRLHLRPHDLSPGDWTAGYHFDLMFIAVKVWISISELCLKAPRSAREHSLRPN